MQVWIASVVSFGVVAVFLVVVAHFSPAATASGSPASTANGSPAAQPAAGLQTDATASGDQPVVGEQHAHEAERSVARVRFPSWRWMCSAVHVDSAWDLSDSWLSNTAAFGGAAAGLLTAAGGLSQFAGTSQGIVATTSLLFSAAALAAPVTFGALSRSPDTSGPHGLQSAVVGSLGGLFAGAGLIGLVAATSTGSNLDKGVVLAGLALGAVLTALYSGRTLHNLATYVPPTDEAVEGVHGASLLKGRRGVSGTL